MPRIFYVTQFANSFKHKFKPNFLQKFLNDYTEQQILMTLTKPQTPPHHYPLMLCTPVQLSTTTVDSACNFLCTRLTAGFSIGD